MKKNQLTDQEKKGVATAAGVAAGIAVGGSAAYAATRTDATDDAQIEAEEQKVEAANQGQHASGQSNLVTEVEVVVENDPPTDNTPTVEVLSYDTVEYEGQLVDIADVDVDGTTHRYVDADRDGFADVEGVDNNHDGYFQDDEIHELKPQTVSMGEFKEAYNTPGGGANDEFLALNNEGPDYVDEVSYHDSGIDSDVMV